MEDLLSQINNISSSGYLLCTSLIVIAQVAFIQYRIKIKGVLALQNLLFAFASLLVLMYMLPAILTIPQVEEVPLSSWSSKDKAYGWMFLVAIGVKILSQGFWFIHLRYSQYYSIIVWVVMLGLILSSPISAIKGYWAFPLPNTLHALFLQLGITEFYLDGALIYLIVVAFLYYGFNFYKRRQTIVKSSE